MFNMEHAKTTILPTAIGLILKLSSMDSLRSSG